MGLHKLLVVHPTERYDTQKLTRSAIRDIVRDLPKENVFVLKNDETYSDYLDRNDLENILDSGHGEINDDTFFSNLLRGTTKLTIPGHIGGDCNYRAYKAVLGKYVKEGEGDLQIILPTNAISTIYGWNSGKSIADYVIGAQEFSPYALEIGLERRKMYFDGPINDQLEIITMSSTADYIVELFEHAYNNYDFDVVVNGRRAMKYRQPNGNDVGKKITLEITNTPMKDISIE